MSGFRARPREVSRGGADSTGDPATVKRRRGRPLRSAPAAGGVAPPRPAPRSPTRPIPAPRSPHLLAQYNQQPSGTQDPPAAQWLSFSYRTPPTLRSSVHPTPWTSHPAGDGRAAELTVTGPRVPPPVDRPFGIPGVRATTAGEAVPPALGGRHRDAPLHRAGRDAGARAVRSTASPAVRSPWRSRVGAAASSARARSASAQATVTSHQTDPTVE